MFFEQKCVENYEDSPSQFDVKIRSGTDPFQSLEVQISSHIPMRQRVPPKARKTNNSGSGAQNQVLKSESPD